MTKKSEIRNCSLGYQCQCSWDALTKLKQESVRFCHTCQREVHDCKSLESLAENIALNRSVHIGKNIFSELEKPSITHIQEITNHRLPGMIAPATKPKANMQYNEPPIDFDDDIPF